MGAKKAIFSPFKSKRAFDEISAEIKKQIITGTLKPGDRLPSEVEIARQFNVSRQTVREALRLLELSGFLRIQKGGGGGPIVTNTVMNTLNDTFLNAIQMKNITVDDLTVARVAVEQMVMSHAVKNATDSDIALLEQNVSAAINELEQGTQAFEKNIEFHVLLAKASKNSVFVIVVEILQAIVADFLTRIPQPLEISAKVLKEHRQILEALKKRDGERAVTLMEFHLRAINDEFGDSFERIAKEGFL